MEAIGHRDAFELMIALADKKEPLTERVVKDLHSLVLMNDARYKGMYRDVPVAVLSAANRPALPYLIAPQMESLMACYKDILDRRHPIEAIAEFHLRFEGIHPFIDGNGRTGRLTINLELIKQGYLPVNIKFADKDKYYACFDDYYGERQTADSLTKLLLNYEINELDRYIKIVEQANPCDC